MKAVGWIFFEIKLLKVPIFGSGYLIRDQIQKIKGHGLYWPTLAMTLVRKRACSVRHILKQFFTNTSVSQRKREKNATCNPLFH